MSKDMVPAIFEQIAAVDFTRLGLSPREAEVLVCVTRGKTNAEVGNILNIRPATVKKHLERVFRKLGVKTRMAAAMVALEGLDKAKITARNATHKPTPGPFLT